MSTHYRCNGLLFRPIATAAVKFLTYPILSLLTLLTVTNLTKIIQLTTYVLRPVD